MGLSGTRHACEAIDHGTGWRLCRRSGEPSGASRIAVLGLHLNAAGTGDLRESGRERVGAQSEERPLLLLRIVLDQDVGDADPLDAQIETVIGNELSDRRAEAAGEGVLLQR